MLVAVQTCLGSMWPTAGIWRLCPALSQTVRFLAHAEAGRDPAALVAQGGNKTSQAHGGKSRTKYGSVSCASSASILHVVCTSQV